jgi:dolichol-phosphate mannosyltransferase
MLFGFGLVFGLYHWWSAPQDQLVPTGTIMIAALTFLIGFQLLLSFLNYDISSSPREALHPFLTRSRPTSAALEPAQPSTPAAGVDLPKPIRRQA